MNDVWGAMADGTRRKILSLLKSRPYTAGEISDQFALSAATVSHHLSVLRSSGLVKTTRRAQTIIYSLEPSAFRDLLRSVSEFART